MNSNIQSYSDEKLIEIFSDGLISKNKIEAYFYKKYLSIFRSISYHYIKKVYSIAIDYHDLISCRH